MSIHPKMKIHIRPSLWIMGLVSICVLALLAALVSRGGTSPSPPNLSRCTCLEIKYYPSAPEYFFYGSPDGGYWPQLLNQTENEFLQSRELHAVNDRERIKAFAESVRLGCYEGPVSGAPSYLTPVELVCYRDGRHLVSFTIFGNALRTQDNELFRYPPGQPNIELALPPQIRSFRLRGECASNLSQLHAADGLFRAGAGRYPEPNRWCDTVLRSLQDESVIENGARYPRYTEDEISGFFVCPSACEIARAKSMHSEPNDPDLLNRPALSSLRSHYAINPLCRYTSAPDMVLLFESRPAWNQHGGPELFTFDNHEPKGGCVLLNDGTVKFIRTEEALKQLRWK